MHRSLNGSDMPSSVRRLTSLPWFRRSARFVFVFAWVLPPSMRFVTEIPTIPAVLLGLMAGCCLIRSGVEVSASGELTRWWGLLFPWVRWDQTVARARLMMVKRSPGSVLTKTGSWCVADVSWLVLSFGKKNIPLYAAATPEQLRLVCDDLARKTGLDVIDAL